MYLLPEETLDSGFDTNRTTIFPSNSPVTNLEPVTGTPTLMPRKKFGRMADGAYSRFKPLMKMRESLDKVHANGYFEQHYPEADKMLKRLLHEHTLDAWGNAANQSSEVLSSIADDKKELGSKDKSISVTINIQ